MKNFRKFQKQAYIVTALSLLFMLLTVVPVLSQVTGPCVDCHTMHNSQDGDYMATKWVGGSLVADDTPNARLLKRDGCVACHRGIYNSGSTDTMDQFAKVWDSSVTGATDYSAGGNFKFVANGDDTLGHNVFGINNTDTNFPDNVPPGFDNTFIGPQGTPRGDFDATHQLTCAGTYGCHGDPSQAGDFQALSGAHHGVEQAGSNGAKGFSDGSDIANSYRFLYGIKGVEDADWEYTNSSTDHNQYHGEDRAANTATDDTTISHLCCECHGDFHAADDETVTGFGSPWIRHPTDFDMTNTGATSEYRQYNNNAGTGTDGLYSNLAPVASSMGSVVTGGVPAASLIVGNVYTDTIAGVADTAIVTCVSCHRAHGSEFADLLRWDYDTTSAGSGLNTSSGCFVCHTTKDDNSI